MSAVITHVIHKVSDHHLHEWQGLAPITPQLLHQLPTVGVDKCKVIFSNLGNQLHKICILSFFCISKGNGKTRV